MRQQRKAVVVWRRTDDILIDLALDMEMRCERGERRDERMMAEKRES